MSAATAAFSESGYYPRNAGATRLSWPPIADNCGRWIDGWRATRRPERSRCQAGFRPSRQRGPPIGLSAEGYPSSHHAGKTLWAATGRRLCGACPEVNGRLWNQRPWPQSTPISSRPGGARGGSAAPILLISLFDGRKKSLRGKCGGYWSEECQGIRPAYPHQPGPRLRPHEAR
jgi:hypothetical protein